jgi:hypothetical protein
MADDWYASMAAGFVTLPVQVVTAGGDLLGSLVTPPRGATKQLYKRVPTSIEGLAPDSPLSRSVSGMPIDTAVTYHSIIANHMAADTPGGSDLVVPYESAHLDGAASEKIVHDTHRCTDNPLVIREVRRILLEHAAAEATP